MHVAAITEFPFVEGLPKREKSKLARLWDQVGEMRALMAEHGTLLPPRFAGELLGVSYQRIHQLMDSGRLVKVHFGGHVFVSENSLVELAHSERKNGRPFSVKAPTLSRCADIAKKIA